MSALANAWGVTSEEYHAAARLLMTEEAQGETIYDISQMLAFYRGDLFNRDAAARAVRLIRARARRAAFQVVRQ